MLHSTLPSPELAIQQDLSAMIAERVRSEFREMPGLTLTPAQAGRLWSLDALTCARVLSQLVDAGFLCKKSDGAFCRASDLTARLRMAKANIETVEMDQPRKAAQA